MHTLDIRVKRGTTPTHEFTIDLDTSLIAKLRVIYSQDNKMLFKKTEADCKLDGNIVTLKLTQEDTFKFDCKKFVQIQLRGKTLGGDALETDIMTVCVDECLDTEKEVL